MKYNGNKCVMGTQDYLRQCLSLFDVIKPCKNKAH